MKHLIDVSAKEAKAHFLKGSSYFNRDFPEYISFEPVLEDIARILGDMHYPAFKKEKPDSFLM